MPLLLILGLGTVVGGVVLTDRVQSLFDNDAVKIIVIAGVAYIAFRIARDA